MDLLSKVKRYGDRLSKFPCDVVDEKEALRCLAQLSKIPMTRAILEESMIGRALNQFRKSEAVAEASPAVCKQCKELIRHWKVITIQGLSPPKAAASNAQPSPVSSSSSKPATVAVASQTPSKDIAKRPTASKGQASSSQSTSTADTSSSARDFAAMQFKRPGQRVARRPSNSSPVEEAPKPVAKKPKPSTPVTTSAASSSVKKRLASASDAPPPKRHRSDKSSERQSESVPLSPPQTTYRRPAVPPPPPQDSRHAQSTVLDTGDMDVGRRSHDQHTMYSGRKRGQVGNVPSLMTLAMRVLIDHIDCIEETYLPFHVLEPLLEKASAKQLARLESFNPQVCEDTSELWKRHCMKDLRAARPQKKESWKDCYFRTLEEKEQRLENLAARINQKKSQEALEASKHAAKLTDCRRMPARRTGMATSGWQKSSSAIKPTSAPLMAKTMKMAQASRRNPQMKLGRR